jgi:myo-inositol 2-dehydrogenase/D-chiro-inositol 1-dehydrogenase
VNNADPLIGANPQRRDPLVARHVRAGIYSKDNDMVRIGILGGRIGANPRRHCRMDGDGVAVSGPAARRYGEICPAQKLDGDIINSTDIDAVIIGADRHAFRHYQAAAGCKAIFAACRYVGGQHPQADSIWPNSSGVAFFTAFNRRFDPTLPMCKSASLRVKSAALKSRDPVAPPHQSATSNVGRNFSRHDDPRLTWRVSCSGRPDQRVCSGIALVDQK